LKNIANNGRALFNFATLVPGALSQETGNRELGSVGGFTVNGQRPNSNNITIDGVANIDTGDNGGNMATTNIDAVAEFKILTNAYQAEYGRAVGGQLQVVTKSGSQAFRGSGYWYGRRSDWDANTYLNKRETPEVPKAETARNDAGYTIGGPIFFPGFNQDKKKLFFFFSQEFQRRSNPANVHQTRVPTALERRGDFSQSVDSSGNPFARACHVRPPSVVMYIDGPTVPAIAANAWRASSGSISIFRIVRPVGRLLVTSLQIAPPFVVRKTRRRGDAVATMITCESCGAIASVRRIVFATRRSSSSKRNGLVT